MMEQCHIIFSNDHDRFEMQAFGINGNDNLSKPIIKKIPESTVKKNIIFSTKKHDHSDIFCNFALSNKDEEKQH